MTAPVIISRDASGDTIGGVEQTGRVYITGPHFGADVFSSTRDPRAASTFSPEEAMELCRTRHWRNPRIEGAQR